ncbi:MAG: PKD domain-containing protein [Candidatus Bipolaricaulota bacterium]|nr:PKD domain-containing protein [Candidatus Bipolaricaulota bacterium]MCS7274691.1 PKD domain-containing protein [Candidatus Bipolaricaulota bacterium]MDW8111375.1 PKD domain-containing protein [Candidatus Bipolaricaulota bacterium]MDW8329380.1 PKD domain-containing protein [Candidatus Bipolaricaulota bacterium]
MKTLRVALWGLMMWSVGGLMGQAQPAAGFVSLGLVGPSSLCALDFDGALVCKIRLGQTLQVWAKAHGSPAWAPISLIAHWLPDHASFEAVWRHGEAVQVFTFTPQEEHVTEEPLRVRFIARNDYASEWRELRVFVQANRPPVADAGPDQTVQPGQIVLLSAFESADPDGELLTYRWRQIEGPPVLLFGDETPFAVFLAPAAPAKLVFRLIVSDSAYSAYKDITVSVEPKTALLTLPSFNGLSALFDDRR